MEEPGRVQESPSARMLKRTKGTLNTTFEIENFDLNVQTNCFPRRFYIFEVILPFQNLVEQFLLIKVDQKLGYVIVNFSV